MPIDLSVLQGLPLFAALPEGELRLLAEAMRPVAFADGAQVLQEGDDCGEFYIILSGQVDVVKALGTPDERLLAVRSAGTVVGELSLFSPGRRHTASVLARGPVDMLAMTRAEFDRLLSSEPRLAYGMVRTLSLRLIEAEQTTIRELRAKNDALAEALRALQVAQAQLVESEKLERELEVARRIQRSLLSSQPPRLPGCNLGARMEPMSAVGGDFYDFVEFADGRVGIAIGDVSDHGVPAALLGSVTMTLLRSAARRGADYAAADPAEVLRSVNRGLLEYDMSGMFVTLLYGLLDPGQREFVYARAGHEPPLLHLGPAAPVMSPPSSAEESGMWIVDPSAWAAASRPSAGGAGTDRLSRRGKKGKMLSGAEGRKPGDEWRVTKNEGPKTAASASSSFILQPSHLPTTQVRGSFRRGQALGVFPSPELDEQRLPLPPRSTLLLYTDGAREAWDPAGNMFGEQGLRAVLAQTEAEPAQVVCDRLFQRLASYRGPSVPQQDDITLVAIKYS